MRFLIDECLHKSLVDLTHAAGFEATHQPSRPERQPDWALTERIIKDEFTFVTNNRVDFVRLFGKIDLHLGLVVLVPNAAPALQRALFQAALQYAAQRDLVNTVVEVSLEGKSVRCVEYQLPAG
ncbi:MAG TPA: DUF5615 family PIN-like protein [Bryobacteraceae bacterium]|nr:DUF5615 family PIN-like protein [Bryobacteraceae bacterium]